jgi:hypothetical protein
VLLRLEKGLKARGHHVEKVSLTHVACRRLQDAKTAHSFIHRFVLHGRFHGWLLIDECYMLPASVLSLLEQLATVGVKFCIFGGWRQLPPPLNSFRASPVRPDAFRRSRLLHLWAEGTEFQLTRCLRSNREHFDFCLNLCDMPLDEAKALCWSTFAPRDDEPVYKQADVHLAVSHRRRVNLNDQCQRDAVKRYRRAYPDGRVVHIGDAACEGLNKPQEFDLFSGTRLIGACDDCGVVNGGFMTMGALRENDCDVTNEFGASFILTHLQVAKSTRLARRLQ